jgi:methylenetetrahydrofolate reductase (NADPH)
MHIQDIFDKHTTTFSFEFFPPKSESASEALFETIRDLSELSPSFVSVTYGAGGSTRELTHDLVERIQSTTDISAIPHLTCVCHREQEVGEILQRYAKLGVNNILALGGDPPRDVENYNKADDDFQYAADLVRFIREFKGHPDPRGFGVGVAGFPEGHPSTPNRLLELDRLKAKVDAGADYICTQLFFDNRDYFDFRERCDLAGIKVPIIAGIMPITSTKGLKRMAELALGARYPASLLKALARCGDDESAVGNVGIHWATEQCRALLDHDVAGLHFYTLNKSDATRRIYEQLGVTDAAAIERVRT